MLVLPKMPSSLTPLCSAESRPFDRPVALANICAIICARLTPSSETSPGRGAAGKNPVFLPQAETVPTMIASWPMPV
jgi:hypothetical protein